MLTHYSDGHSTRLRALTLSAPSALIEFANKPVVVHQLEMLEVFPCNATFESDIKYVFQRAGIEEVVIILSMKSYRYVPFVY